MPNIRRVVMRVPVVTVVGIALAVHTWATTQAQQGNLELRVETQQREVRARIEKARRAMEHERRQAETRTKTPPVSRSPSRSSDHEAISSGHATSNKTRPSHERIEYKFTPGKTFAYAFLLETTKDQRTLYVAGFALFQVEENSAGTARISARDNLRHISDLASLEPASPHYSRMIDATLHVDQRGYEPRVENTLPQMLGRPVDWFFPPLPDSATGSRTEGYSVERGSMPQGTPKWDKQNRGYFRWEVKAASNTPSQLTMNDSRILRTDDRSLDLVGSGQIDFDKSQGLMTRRTFQGTFTSLGRLTQISLKIDQLSDQQLRQLTK